MWRCYLERAKIRTLRVIPSSAKLGIMRQEVGRISLRQVLGMCRPVSLDDPLLDQIVVSLVREGQAIPAKV